MKNIEYKDNGELFFYSVEDFIEEAWNLSFEYVLQIAEQNIELRKPLINQLFLRAKKEPYISMIKTNPYYLDLVDEIVNGNDQTKKIHLVLYYEPRLLNRLFKTTNNLANSIMDNSEDFFMYDVAEKLVQLSTFDIDDNTLNYIICSIEQIFQEEFQQIKQSSINIIDKYFPNTNNKLKKDMESAKEQYIDRVKRNKLIYSKKTRLQ